MTTAHPAFLEGRRLRRPHYWCLHWQQCGYNGESLTELIEHHHEVHAPRFINTEWEQRQAFMAAGRRAGQMARDMQAEVDRILFNKAEEMKADLQKEETE